MLHFVNMEHRPIPYNPTRWLDWRNRCKNSDPDSIYSPGRQLNQRPDAFYYNNKNQRGGRLGERRGAAAVDIYLLRVSLRSCL